MTKNCVFAALLFQLLNVDAKSLWSTQPANFTNIIQTAYPVGNGQLAGKFGNATAGTELGANLNSITIWSPRARDIELEPRFSVERRPFPE